MELCFGTDAQWEYGLGQCSREKYTEERFSLSDFSFKDSFRNDFIELRNGFFDKGTLSKRASYYGIFGSGNELIIDTSKHLDGTWPVGGQFDNPYYGKTRAECKKVLSKYLRDLRDYANQKSGRWPEEQENIVVLIDHFRKAK